MLITRYDEPFGTFERAVWPLAAFDQLRRDMDRVLQDWDLESAPQRGDAISTPGAALTETSDSYEYAVELPGVTESDLDVQVTAQSLSISAKRQEKSPEGYRPTAQERTDYVFSRSYHLPTRIDTEAVSARLELGILNLKLPKAKEYLPRQITVSGS